LRNFAQRDGHDPWLNNEGPALRRQLEAVTNRASKVIMGMRATLRAAMLTGVIELGSAVIGDTASWEIAAAGGVAWSALLALRERKFRHKHIVNLQGKLSNYYKNWDEMGDPNDFGTPDYPLLEAIPVEGKPWVVVSALNLKATEPLADSTHKKLSLSPPATA
jgi:hypothetical protein